MFLTNMFDTIGKSIPREEAYENREGVFMNADYRNLIGCLGCLSHSSLRSRPAPPANPLAKENLTVGMVAAYESGYEQGAKDERERVLKELTDETIIRDLHIADGEFSLATEGVIGHQLIRLITDFYETNGNAPNFFTFEISGKVRDKHRRFGITICELINGKKSPAQTINELRKEIESLRTEVQK